MKKEIKIDKKYIEENSNNFLKEIFAKISFDNKINFDGCFAGHFLFT